MLAVGRGCWEVGDRGGQHVYLHLAPFQPSSSYEQYTPLATSHHACLRMQGTQLQARSKVFYEEMYKMFSRPDLRAYHTSRCLEYHVSWRACEGSGVCVCICVCVCVFVCQAWA